MELPEDSWWWWNLPLGMLVVVKIGRYGILWYGVICYAMICNCILCQVLFYVMFNVDWG